MDFSRVLAYYMESDSSEIEPIEFDTLKILQRLSMINSRRCRKETFSEFLFPALEAE